MIFKLKSMDQYKSNNNESSEGHCRLRVLMAVVIGPRIGPSARVFGTGTHSWNYVKLKV